MDELILRSLQGRATGAEEQALLAWRRQAPDNEACYRELAGLWELTGAAAAPRSVPAPTASSVIAAAGRRRSILRLPMQWRGARPAARRAGGLVAAAAIVIAVALARLLAPPEGPDAPRTDVFATGRGELRTVKLTDGSVVRLAEQTVVRFRAGTEREAWLEGRAFFAVAERTGSRFVVRTPIGEARVLGTRFVLSSDEQSLKLVVVEGRVELAADEGTVEVGAGQGSRVVEGRMPVVQSVPDVRSAVSWLGDVLIFQDTPLAQALIEVEQHYRVAIELADSTVGARTVTAVFADQDFLQVFTTICRVVDLHCTLDESGGVIRP